MSNTAQHKCSKPEACMWHLDTHHDFAQFVPFGPDVVHEHLIRSELVLDGQRVVLTLLHLFQLDSFTQVPHHLNPESSLTEEANGSMGKEKWKLPWPLEYKFITYQQSSVGFIKRGGSIHLNMVPEKFFYQCLFKVVRAFVQISLC